MISKTAIANFLRRETKIVHDVKSLKKSQWQNLFFGNTSLPTKTAPYTHQFACSYLGIIENEFLFFCSMGLGKTKIILDTFSYRKLHFKKSEKYSRVLVLSPNRLTVDTWEEQTNVHSNLSSISLTGTIEERWDALLMMKGKDGFSSEKTDLILLNYTGLLMMVTDNIKNKWVINKEKLNKFCSHFDSVVFDEIHLLKNKSSLSFKICNKISKSCKARFGLTGTPFNRNPIDLWSIFYLIDRGKSLGETISLFREAFFTSKKNIWGFKNGRQLYSKDYTLKKELEPVLKDKMEGVSIRYSKEEVQDLPEKVYITSNYKLPSSTMSFYLKEKESSSDSFEEIENKYIKRRQICSGYLGYRDEDGQKGFMAFDENPKLDLLIELIKQTEEEAKVVVALEYIESGNMVCERLKEEKIKFERIYSGTKDKIASKNQFMSKKDCKVLVGNSKSIGIGVDGLQKVSSYLFMYESPSSNIDRMQLEDRLHRTGQTNRTFIYDLCFDHEESVEKKILSFIKEGKNYFQSLIDKIKR